jgi:hypothetical protein
VVEKGAEIEKLQAKTVVACLILLLMHTPRSLSKQKFSKAQAK